MKDNINKFKDKILKRISERINEKSNWEINRYFITNYNEHEKYVSMFEENKIKIINEIVDSLSGVKIEKIIEKVNRKSLKSSECCEINCNVYSLEIAGEENWKGLNNIEVTYVTEILTDRLDGVIESTLLWI